MFYQNIFNKQNLNNIVIKQITSNLKFISSIIIKWSDKLGDNGGLKYNEISGSGCYKLRDHKTYEGEYLVQK